jgi:hypothetical protein
MIGYSNYLINWMLGKPILGFSLDTLWWITKITSKGIYYTGSYILNLKSNNENRTVDKTKTLGNNIDFEMISLTEEEISLIKENNKLLKEELDLLKSLRLP